jgi:hypothetical protein
MTSILKVDTIQDTAGNNIINESGDTITIGASGDTITIPSGATISNLGTATGFGKVLQVITATDDTQRDTSSTSFVTASNTLSVSITPASTSNKVFINVTGAHLGSSEGFYTIFRDATNLGSSNGFSMMNNGATTGAMGFGMSVLDSPNTTSEITYQVYLKATSGSTARINNSSVRGTITCFEIAG